MPASLWHRAFEIIEQHAHQLRNAQHRMGVVELDGDLLMQVVQVRIAAQMPPDDLIDAGTRPSIRERNLRSSTVFQWNTRPEESAITVRAV